MQQSPVIPQLARYGSWAAIILLILTIAWIVSVAFAPMPGTDANAEERITFLADHEGWHILNFAIVVPMGLVHVPLWLGLAALVWERRPPVAALIAAFGLLYAPFTVIGYWTQLTTVRGIIHLYDTNPDAAIAAFEVLDFSGEPWSLSYGIVVLGYGTWGIAAIAVMAGLAGINYRLARVTAGLFGLSGFAGVVGAVGLVAGSAMLELGVLLSGIVFVPVLVGVSVLLHQVANGLDLGR
jgi:hypothetical protein